ncbi:MAG: GAF domain-containing protein [Scytonema sp. RU_4_4]|nr:GAF domain-containing protein [Scytonema sp. RU_4_4]
MCVCIAEVMLAQKSLIKGFFKEKHMEEHYLNTSNINWESELQEHNDLLQLTTQAQQVFFDVAAQIRASVDLETIFQTTNRKVCELLQAERVAVYRFNSDWNGEFIHDYEFTTSEWKSLFKLSGTTIWDDTYLQQTQGGRYRNNETFAVDDISQAGHTPCHTELLEQFHIKAYAIAPIFTNKKLWGLLAAYQLSKPRHWQTTEVKLLNQIADQLGLALQQAELLTQIQQQTLDLEKITEQKQLLIDVAAQIRASVDLETIFQTTNRKVCELLQAERVAVYRFNPDWNGEFIHDYEFTTSEWKSLFKLSGTTIWDDTYLQQTQGGRYRNNETFAVDDISQAGHTPCHFEILDQFHIKAYAIAPIFTNKKLWGLLAAYQLSKPRHWQITEIKFLNQIADQLGLALQQAELLTQIQQHTLALQNITERHHSLLKKFLNKGKFLEVVQQDTQKHVEDNPLRSD